ncbi:hypothetical protein FQZ97_823370 [compost metagenome]
MLAPRPWAIRRGSSMRVLYIRPLMLVSTMVSQSSRLHLGAGSAPSARPALLIRPRIFSYLAGSPAMAASMACRSRTSSSRVCTSVSAESSSLSACRRAARRPVSTSDQPAWAKRLAQASPNPEVAPVMKTVEVMLFSLLWGTGPLRIDRHRLRDPQGGAVGEKTTRITQPPSPLGCGFYSQAYPQFSTQQTGTTRGTG